LLFWEGNVQQEVIDRFWAKVDIRGLNDCWLWQARTRSGYGYFQFSRETGRKIGSRDILAHRMSWVIEHGSIPDNMCICHRCDTPLCVNPAHLFLGTQRDNLFDMAYKGRSNLQGLRRGSPCGSKNPSAKLGEEDVRQIRVDYASGICSQFVLAQTYGVSQSNISSIVRYKTWAILEATNAKS